MHKCLPLEERYYIKKHKPKGSVNDEKLDCNISRSRGQIYEYGLCNDWQYFFTGTLNKKNYNRYDLKKFKTNLSQWLRDYSRKHEIKITYLFIPENHKDGAWHIHGLLDGLPEEHLTDFIPGKHSQKIIDAGYKNWVPYADNFGYVTIDKIKNKDAISNYITKYVKKSMATRNKELNAHLFYSSNGLKKAEIIKKGMMSDNIIPDFENDYVKIIWEKNRQVALSYFE